MRLRTALALALILPLVPGCDDLLGPGDGDVLYVVGSCNTALRYDGSAWSFITGPDGNHFYSVWGTSATDVYAVRSGRVRHYDGETWADLPEEGSGEEPYITALWGTDSDDIVAVGRHGAILHYDGVRWSRMVAPPEPYSPELWHRAVWGSGPDDIFAVGISRPADTAIIRHYDGETWTDMKVPTTTPAETWIHDVWGRGPDDVYAVGQSGSIYHYDGVEWSLMARPVSVYVVAIHGSGPTVFAVGRDGTILRLAGDQWTEMDGGTDASLYDVWVRDADDVFAVGAGGTILHYDGTGWRPIENEATSNLNAIWGP